MRKYILTVICCLGLLWVPGIGVHAAEIQQMDPPFWWVGMKNPTLQVLVHGPNIAASQVSVKYGGVTLKDVVKTTNPNYLFLYFDISSKAKPGKMDITFSGPDGKTVRQFELRERSKKPGAQGFSPKDVLYLITPDRFADGDPSNNDLEGARTDRSRAGGRHGGDIKGVLDHMDYIQDLGMTTIWLNPVQKNSANSYHGYAITDYYDIDPRFGTMEQYIKFVDEAHARGMKVVMDMIFNHCGSGHWWMSDLPTGDWLNFDNTFVGTSHNKWTAVDPHAAPSERKLFTDGWFNSGMPDLNQRNPLVADYLIQNCIWWIEYARIDGVRQDTHPYMDPIFGARWCKETLEEYPDFNITGETWYPLGSGFPAWWQHDSPLNPAYNSYLKTVMDFNLAFLSGDAFTQPNNSADGAATGLFNIYVSMANDVLYSDLDNILVFLDNHDLGRFSRKEDVGLNRYKQGIAFLLTTRGIPQVYYGTELLFKATKQQGDGAIRIDMPGGFPGDTRSVFTREGRTAEENEAWDYMQKILQWRKGSKAVAEGKLIQYAPLREHGDCYVYARIKDDETVLVILNGADRDADISMSRYKDVIGDHTAGRDVVTGNVYTLVNKLHVPARGTLILDLFTPALTLAPGSDIPAPPYASFSEGLIDKIQPEGWLKEILERQRDGLTGHPEAMAYPYNSVLWAGKLERDSESRGADWWRFEQTAYYLDGLTRLGFLLDDKKFLDIWQQNIDYVLDHPLPFKEGEKPDPATQQQGNRGRGGQGGFGGGQNMSPEQIQQMMQNMTPEQRQQMMQRMQQAGQGQRPQGQNPQAQGQRPRQGQGGGDDFNAQVSADPRAQQRAQQQAERRAKQQRIAAADRPEGRLGPETGSMAWPWAVFFRAVKAYYEATGDPRIPEALEKNYLSYTVEELGMNRFVVNVEGMLWTYSITKNPELLARAVKAWDENASDMTQATALDDSEFHMHGVTMNELLKIPLILYSYTGEQRYLDAALHAEAKMEGPNMLIDGINSSTEALAGNDPLASHETCDVSDYTWTMGYYLMTTGDGQWADRIEKGIFNGGLGSITKDFKTMQYFSCPNQVIATGISNHNGFKHGSTWMAYRPIHETECCIGNLHRYMPNYVARMWLRDKKGNPVAALYGPSSVEYDLGGGVTVKIEEKTDYPFEEQVRFTFSFFENGKPSNKSYNMDFTYRIPGWCKAATPGFKTVSKTWKTGDTFTVDLPMDIEIVDNPVAGTSVQRGPVVYTFAVPAKVEEDPQIYGNMAGKVSANPDFKNWSMTPDGKWNYALVRSGLKDLKVEKTGAVGFPFDPQSVPLKIRVPVVGVQGWTLQDNRYTPALPEKVQAEGPVQYIDLVPYGSTTLRLTIFPTVEK